MSSDLSQLLVCARKGCTEPTGGARYCAKHGKKAVLIAEVTVRITQEPILVKASSELAFNRAEDADPLVASLLLFDPKIGAFRPVLTPPGTSWELVEKRQGPGIWLPGMRRS